MTDESRPALKLATESARQRNSSHADEQRSVGRTGDPGQAQGAARRQHHHRRHSIPCGPVRQSQPLRPTTALSAGSSGRNPGTSPAGSTPSSAARCSSANTLTCCGRSGAAGLSISGRTAGASRSPAATARTERTAAAMNRYSPDERPIRPPRRQDSHRIGRSTTVILLGRRLEPCRRVDARCARENLDPQARIGTHVSCRQPDWPSLAPILNIGRAARGEAPRWR